MPHSTQIIYQSCQVLVVLTHYLGAVCKQSILCLYFHISVSISAKKCKENTLKRNCKFRFCMRSDCVLRQHFSVSTSCRRAAATIRPRPSPPSVGAEAPRAAELTAPADGNVAVGSDAQHVPTITAAAAWRVNATVSKVAWWPFPLTFWPWKWCLSHVWRGLPLCQF